MEESFDVTFDDLFVRNTSHNYVTSHIRESDTPSSDKPVQQVIVNIEFDSLFGLPRVTLDVDVLNLNEASVSTNSSVPILSETST